MTLLQDVRGSTSVAKVIILWLATASLLFGHNRAREAMPPVVSAATGAVGVEISLSPVQRGIVENEKVCKKLEIWPPRNFFGDHVKWLLFCGRGRDGTIYDIC